MRSIMPAAAVLSVALCGTSAAAVVSPSDPQAIFAAARTAWNFTSYPRYANYVVTVRYANSGQHLMRRYDTLEDLRRSIVFAHSFSREEAANPTTPHGTNFGMLGMTLNAAQPDDPIGPVALAVTYDFGISLSAVSTQVAQTGSEVAAPKRYPVIGRTGTQARTYDVRLLDLLDGGQTYHLGLTPLRDPGRNRLREMWVSARTYVTDKILVAANFSRQPYTGVAWLVTFAQLGGGPYIAREKAQAPLDFGAAGSLDDVTIDFEELRATSDLPPFGTVGINDGAPEFLTEP